MFARIAACAAAACLALPASAEPPTILGLDFTAAKFTHAHFHSTLEEVRDDLVPRWSREASFDLRKRLEEEGIRPSIDLSPTNHENRGISARQLSEDESVPFFVPSDDHLRKETARYAGGKGLALVGVVESLSEPEDAVFLHWILFERASGRPIRAVRVSGRTEGNGLHDVYLEGFRRASRAAARELAKSVRQAAAPATP